MEEAHLQDMTNYVEDERDTTQMLSWDKPERDIFGKSFWKTNNMTRYDESSYTNYDPDELFEDIIDEFYEYDYDDTYEETESQDYEDFEINAQLLQAHDFAYS